MTKHAISLDLRNGRGTIEVNGVDVGDYVTSLRLIGKARKLPELQLTFQLPTMRIEALGSVALPSAIQELLRSLGWTPPEKITTTEPPGASWPAPEPGAPPAP
jgi:hypothetical protein